MDGADYVLIGCVCGLALLALLLLIALWPWWTPKVDRPVWPRAFVQTDSQRIVRRILFDQPVQQTITLVNPPRCKAIRNGGHILIVRAIGCDRCRGAVDVYTLCNPVEATADEVEALERLRREAKVS